MTGNAISTLFQSTWKKKSNRLDYDVSSYKLLYAVQFQ